MAPDQTDLGLHSLLERLLKHFSRQQKQTTFVVIGILRDTFKTSKGVLLQTVKTQMKCSIMLHFIRVCSVKVRKIFRQNNTICFENYNPTPLNMYNGLSQSYCIKPERRIH